VERERGKKHVTPRDAEGGKSVAQNAPRNTGGVKSIKGLFSFSFLFFCSLCSIPVMLIDQSEGWGLPKECIEEIIKGKGKKQIIQ